MWKGMRVVFEVDVDDEVAKSEKSQSWPGCRLHGCMLSSASRGSVRLGLVISLAQSDNHPLSVGIFQVLLIYIAYNSITTTVVRNKPSAHPSIHSNTSHLDPHSKVGRKKKSSKAKLKSPYEEKGPERRESTDKKEEGVG